eukprot:CAMPEP_0183316034 /NCGR_PEP_ID=MMETSP0160_2-20130417/53669_1 /TAXON_ID=2839 ORGANISM="Odontella Sinensis, Strain Grunow 1884" /NCGR_SAMPLE_ID=MMETSP0160_2 /ASSEMBLY_ACC=CAM_ASM_000250 /LENGTH=65 /DNA_ID=CAMNT_0025481735 /DNA_START=85 /DNA_END=278 /DNA_ORIENTATION=-
MSSTISLASLSITGLPPRLTMELNRVLENATIMLCPRGKCTASPEEEKARATSLDSNTDRVFRRV